MAFSRPFWQIRRALRLILFRTARGIHGAEESAHRQWLTLSLQRQILRAILAPALAAPLSILAIEFLEDSLEHVDRFVAFRAAWQRLDAVAFAVPLVSTVAQIGGVFLGLYFATVSIVASTSYSSVSPDIRGLLLEERVSNHYVRTLAFVTAFSAWVLLLNALGVHTRLLVLGTCGVLGIYAVLSFVVLGKRAFNFFDPSALAAELPTQIRRSITRAAKGSGRWKQPEFQQHAQRQTAAKISVLRQLVLLASRPTGCDKHSLAGIGSYALQIALLYASRKSAIPTKSYWFRRRFRHQDWFRSSSSELLLALNAGIPMPPQEVEDLDWLERDLRETVEEVLKKLLSARHLDECISILNFQSTILEVWGRNLLVDEALDFWERMLGVVLRQIEEHVPPDREFSAEHSDAMKTVAVIDAAAAGLSSIAVGFGGRFRDRSPGELRTMPEDLTRLTRHAISVWPRTVIREAEVLADAVSFERQIEGKIYTADWYVSQLLALSFGRYINHLLQRVSAALTRAIAEQVDRAVASDKTLIAAQLIVRLLETANKVDFHLGVANEYRSRLDELRRVADIPWFEHESGWSVEVKEARNRLVRQFSILSDRLYQLPRSDWAPDYFGQAYALIANRCWECLIAKDSEFESLFAALARAALQAQTRGASATETPAAALARFADPLLDIVDLSGYALAIAEIQGGGLERPVVSWWDSYLRGMPNGESFVDLVIAAIDLMSTSLFGARSLVRTNWKLQFDSILRDHGLAGRETGDWDERSDSDALRSPVAAALAGRSSAFSGIDIFCALYLADRPEALGKDFPGMAAQLRRIVVRLRERSSAVRTE